MEKKLGILRRITPVIFLVNLKMSRNSILRLWRILIYSNTYNILKDRVLISFIIIYDPLGWVHKQLLKK